MHDQPSDKVTVVTSLHSAPRSTTTATAWLEARLAERRRARQSVWMIREVHRVKIHTVDGVVYELPSQVAAWWLTCLFRRTALVLGFSSGECHVPCEFSFVRVDSSRHNLTNCIGVFTHDKQLRATITPVL